MADVDSCSAGLSYQLRPFAPTWPKPGESMPFSLVNSPLTVTCRRSSMKPLPQAACSVPLLSSWYLVMPPSTFALKPVNFLSVMKLTTPPIASEP
jgi:hypothetical protein